ncbi:MAG TPA: cell division protein ZipA [Gammaproteobacteria bacterium]|nr:cell division protein ZipA [Gammaproteobacteria bacterium]
MMTLAIGIAIGLVLLVAAVLWRRRAAARLRSLRAQATAFTTDDLGRPFTARREEEGVDYAGTLAELSGWVREAKRDPLAPGTSAKSKRPARGAPPPAQMPLTFAEEAAHWRKVERVITLYVAAPGQAEFNGGDLLDALAAMDMRFGEMSIFHYYGAGQLHGTQPLFSAANMLEPGGFDLSAMERFTTPGIALFLCLPCRLNPGMVFELMLNTAQRLAERLQGRVLDDVREPLNAAAIEHMRRSVKQP